EGVALKGGIVAAVEHLRKGTAGERALVREVEEPFIGLVGGPLDVEAPAPIPVDVETADGVDVAAEVAVLEADRRLVCVGQSAAGGDAERTILDALTVGAQKHRQFVGGENRRDRQVLVR